MKKVLVAGGAGFIGSELCRHLLEAGHEVTVLDSLVTGRRGNIEPLLKQGLRLIEGDIVDRGAIPQERFDQIYNLASPASPVDFARIPIEILRTSAVGHENLLVLAKEHKARIVFASTSEVYGDPLEHPQREEYFGNVNSIGLRSCYDEAKRYAEALTMAYVRTQGINAGIARIFNTYGPRMRGDDGRIIPTFFTQGLRGEALTIFGDGTQTRSFCFVSDLVRGLVALMESGKLGPFNLGNPIEKTVGEMADIVNQLTGNRTPHRHLPLPENDPTRRRPDISKAKNLLGWEPRVSLAEGLQRTFEYFKGL